MREDLIVEMFRLCAPMQIQRAYEHHHGLDPNWIAENAVLRGWFGFKRGIKAARRAPRALAVEGVIDCPAPQVSQEEASRLLADYLQQD